MHAKYVLVLSVKLMLSILPQPCGHEYEPPTAGKIKSNYEEKVKQQEKAVWISGVYFAIYLALFGSYANQSLPLNQSEIYVFIF